MAVFVRASAVTIRKAMVDLRPTMLQRGTFTRGYVGPDGEGMLEIPGVEPAEIAGRDWATDATVYAEKDRAAVKGIVAVWRAQTTHRDEGADTIIGNGID